MYMYIWALIQVSAEFINIHSTSYVYICNYFLYDRSSAPEVETQSTPGAPFSLHTAEMHCR